MLYLAETSWKGFSGKLYIPAICHGDQWNLPLRFSLQNCNIWQVWANLPGKVRWDCALEIFVLWRFSHSFGEWLQHCSVCTEELLPCLCRALLWVSHTHISPHCFLCTASSGLGNLKGKEGTADGELRTKKEQVDPGHAVYVTGRQEASWARPCPWWWCYLEVHTTSSAGDGSHCLQGDFLLSTVGW